MVGFSLGFGMGTNRKGSITGGSPVDPPDGNNLFEGLSWVAGTNTTSPVPIGAVTPGYAQCLRNGTDNPRIWKEPNTLKVGKQYTFTYDVLTGTAGDGGTILRVDTNTNLPSGNKFQTSGATPFSGSTRIDAFQTTYYFGIVPLTSADGQYSEISDDMGLEEIESFTNPTAEFMGNPDTTVSYTTDGLNGEYVVITALNSNNPRASVTVSNLIPGATYRFAYKWYKKTMGGDVFIRIYNDQFLSTTGPVSGSSSAASGESSDVFVATNSTHYFGMVGIPTAPGQECWFSRYASVTYVSGP